MRGHPRDPLQPGPAAAWDRRRGAVRSCPPGSGRSSRSRHQPGLLREALGGGGQSSGLGLIPGPGAAFDRVPLGGGGHGGGGHRQPRTAGGTLHFTVLVPVLLRPPQRTEEEVAGIGTTWTLTDDKDPEALRASTCGVCLDPFEEGYGYGCVLLVRHPPEVWHADCIRRWLRQGQAQTCPLCRAPVGPDRCRRGAHAPHHRPGGSGGAPDAERRAGPHRQDLFRDLLYLALLPATGQASRTFEGHLPAALGGGHVFATVGTLPGGPAGGAPGGLAAALPTPADLSEVVRQLTAAA
ncbi:unnamed protein product, partial [Prorocentrum cordatum]